MKFILGVLLVMFASYSDIFLFRVGVIPVQPSSFLLPFFFILFLIKYPIKEISKSFKSHSFKFLAFVVIISILYSVLSKIQSETLISIIVVNIINLLLYTFAMHYFKVEDKKTITLVILFALLVLGGSLLYDFFIGLPKYNIKLAESVRKGGFGENPNQAASGIKFLALGLLVLINKNKVLRYLTITFMLLTVFLTLSRSGMATVILILVFCTLNDWSSEIKITPKVLVLGMFKLFFLFSILFMALLSFSKILKENFPVFTRGAAGKRMDMFLGKSEVTIDEGGAAGGRSVILFQYWNDFCDNPWGHGTGYSSDKNFNRLNTHNYFLFLAINYGIFALIAFLIHLGISASLGFKFDQFYYLIFLALIVFECFVSHNIWATRALVISLAFFDSRIYKNKLLS